ncbi:MAG: hypothetical protein ACFFFC_16270 [Candidatus Thorarchaeota archaeon]
MKTIEILKVVLNKKYALEVLKALGEGDKAFTDFKDGKKIKYNTQINRVLKLLVRYALASHIIKEVGPKEVSYYTINQRGRDILELVNLMEKPSADESEVLVPTS